MFESSTEFTDMVWISISPLMELSSVCEFYLICATIHVKLYNYLRAKFCLYAVLMVPVSPGEHLAALRRLFLLNLIMDGAPSKLPEHIERQSASSAAIWRRVLVTSIPDETVSSPEKSPKAKRTPSLIYPEEYLKLYTCVDSSEGLLNTLTDLSRKLQFSGDWELANELIIATSVRKLHRLSKIFCMIPLDFCLSTLNREELSSGIQAFNKRRDIPTLITQLETGELKFEKRKTPIYQEERINTLIELNAVLKHFEQSQVLQSIKNEYVRINYPSNSSPTESR